MIFRRRSRGQRRAKWRTSARRLYLTWREDAIWGRAKGPSRASILFRNGETISQITLRTLRSADSCTRNLHMINNHASAVVIGARPLSLSSAYLHFDAPLSEINSFGGEKRTRARFGTLENLFESRTPPPSKISQKSRTSNREHTAEELRFSICRHLNTWN